MGCISFLVKNLIFLVNFVFALAGLVLLILGCIFKFSYVDKLSTDTIPTTFNVISIVVIIVGTIVFVTSFLGCCGALRNSPCMLRAYAALLLTFFIIQLAIGIYAFVEVKDSDFRSDLENLMQKPFEKYSSDQKYKDVVDVLQQTLECCGLHNKSTWDVQGIPKSCCADETSICSAKSKDLFKDGCIDGMYSLLDTAFTVLGYVIIAIAATELFGAIFGCYLSRHMARKLREHY